MNEQMIKNNIISIMKDKLSFKFDDKSDQIVFQNFFSKHFSIAPYELAYLLMEVEKEFQITISETYLIDPGVKTIDSFIKYIIANQKNLATME